MIANTASPCLPVGLLLSQLTYVGLELRSESLRDLWLGYARLGAPATSWTANGVYVDSSNFVYSYCLRGITSTQDAETPQTMLQLAPDVKTGQACLRPLDALHTCPSPPWEGTLRLSLQRHPLDEAEAG